MVILVLPILLVSLVSTLAQTPESSWVQKFKLSGLRGGHQVLAVIAKPVFCSKENEIKAPAFRIVSVKCLEIHETSVLVQIQGIPGPYILTLDGQTYSQRPQTDANPPPQPQLAAASSPQPTVVQMPSAPPAVQPFNPFVPAKLENPLPPMNGGNILSAFLHFVEIPFAVLIGVLIGAAAKTSTRSVSQWHQKNIGEAMLAETIHQQFKRPHLLLNNITLSTPDGTTQIDHILVVDTGIFVIEAKHYSGWIFGNPHEAQWTQTIYQIKSKFPNPLRQNYGHIKAVQALFNLPDDHFHTLVVFTGDAEFKTNLGPNVLHLADLMPFLDAERPVLFDERKMAYVIGRIEMQRKQRSRETDEYHINHVRRQISQKIPKRPIQSQPLSSPAKSEPASKPVSEHPHSRYMPKE